MSIYLGFLDKPRHTQQLINQPHYLYYNKISVNKPVQSHYTVEGVQAYSPEQIKALRERQTRTKQYNGQWAPLKVVLLSDKIIQFDEGQDPLKQAKQKELTYKKEKAKEKTRPQTANKQRVKTNVRNAVSTNNQAIVKLQKQIQKKNSLQRKLQKMSQKYKQYFKDIDMKQGLKVTKKADELNDKSEQISQYEQQKHSESRISEDKKEENNDKTTYQRSSKIGKSKKDNKIQFQIEENDIQQSENNPSKIMSLDLAYDLVMQSTTYSEKLGTAIHEMFK